MRGQYEIAGLVTTVADHDGAVPIHRVPGHLIAAQADALELPLWTVPLPQPCSNAVYAERLQPVWDRAAREGIDTIIFGDLFLTDIRAWREQLMSGTALTPVFPLWLEPTAALAQEMIRGGLRATICAPAALRGQLFNQEFLASLSPDTDPCGENGEFHTFVTHMPGFNRELTLCAESFL